MEDVEAGGFRVVVGHVVGGVGVAAVILLDDLLVDVGGGEGFGGASVKGGLY